MTRTNSLIKITNPEAVLRIVALLDSRITEDTRIDYRMALLQILGDSANRNLETGAEDDSVESRSSTRP